MKLDVTTHKTILFQILKDIYSDTSISPFLGFKGGTAALMFYNLDRFSVDLDFDLLDENKQDLVFEKISKIIQKYGMVREQATKKYNLFFLLSYEDKSHNIKIEINRRQFGSKYEIKTYLGVAVLVMIANDMFAHKLMAMYERFGKTNRDIYDVWFFLKNRFPINKEIVEQRSGMAFDEFIKQCIHQLEHMNNHKILEGIGELLSGSQKMWVKNNLREETIALLKLRGNY